MWYDVCRGIKNSSGMLAFFGLYHLEWGSCDVKI